MIMKTEQLNENPEFHDFHAKSGCKMHQNTNKSVSLSGWVIFHIWIFSSFLSMISKIYIIFVQDFA
jgi:hypothetical protein